MPYVLRPRGLRAGFTALLSALAVFVVPAAAQAACATTPTTKAFQAFGDSNDYSLVPNGGFETGADGWSLSGSAVTAGNEPWTVHGAGDSKSLAIAAAGVAVSPTVCVDITRPTLPLLREAHERQLGRAEPASCAGRTRRAARTRRRSPALDSNFGTAWRPRRR